MSSPGPLLLKLSLPTYPQARPPMPRHALHQCLRDTSLSSPASTRVAGGMWSESAGPHPADWLGSGQLEVLAAAATAAILEVLAGVTRRGVYWQSPARGEWLRLESWKNRSCQSSSKLIWLNPMASAWAASSTWSHGCQACSGPSANPKPIMSNYVRWHNLT